MSSSRLGTKCGGPLRRAALVIGLQHGKNKNMISLLSVVFCVFTLHAFFLHVICLMRAFLFFVFLQSFFFYHDVHVSSAFFSSFVILVIPMFRVFFFCFQLFFLVFPIFCFFAERHTGESNAGALRPNGKAPRPRLTAGLLSKGTAGKGSSSGGDEMTSVCLPRAVAPDIVPVILAFLYTDRLESDPENSSDGYSEAYTDPGARNRGGVATAVEGEVVMEAYRQAGKRGLGSDTGGGGSGGGGGKASGSGKRWVEGTPSEVGMVTGWWWGWRGWGRGKRIGGWGRGGERVQSI